MRYLASIFCITVCSLFSAQQQMHMLIATPYEPTPMCKVESCTSCNLPSQKQITVTGVTMLVSSLLFSTVYSPIPHPAAIILCGCGLGGMCLTACAKPLAEKNCTLYYCNPYFCHDDEQRQDSPATPAPINE